MGDLLITSPTGRDTVIPSIENSYTKLPAGDGHFTAGLAQKVVLLRPWLAVGWAGALFQAGALIKFLDDCLPANNVTHKDVSEILKRYLKQDLDRVEVIIFILESPDIGIISINTGPFDLDHETQCYCLGSGTECFLSCLSDNTRVFEPYKDGMDEIVRSTAVMAQAMYSNEFAQNALSKQWGGAFQIAQLGSNGFSYLDNILFRSWISDKNGNLISANRQFYLFYQNQALIVFAFTGDKWMQPCVVNWPHIALQQDEPLSSDSHPITYVIECAVVEPTTKMFSVLRKTGSIRKNLLDIFEISDGSVRLTLVPHSTNESLSILSDMIRSDSTAPE